MLHSFVLKPKKGHTVGQSSSPKPALQHHGWTYNVTYCHYYLLINNCICVSENAPSLMFKNKCYSVTSGKANDRFYAQDYTVGKQHCGRS